MKIQKLILKLVLFFTINCLKNLHQNQKHQKQVNIDEIIKLKNISRSIDGSGNNIDNHNWGKSYTPIKRTSPPRYQDDKSEIISNLPNARFLSNTIAKLPGNIVVPNKLNLTMLFGTWGQFLDHDITFTQQGPIRSYSSILRCDKTFDKNCTGKQNIYFNRSQYKLINQIRTQINRVTAWIDGSMLYGSLNQTNKALRLFKNGRLNTTNGDMLLINQSGNFYSGDSRVNSNLALTTLHIIFMRQHNRLCDLIVKSYPNLTDQQIFNIARNYVIGLIQKISMYDFLPLLFGKQHWQKLIGQYPRHAGYDPYLDPTIRVQFSTAGYRIGHPYVPSIYKTVDDDGKVVQRLTLMQIFLAKPNLLPADRFKYLVKGLAFILCKERDLTFVDDLRDQILQFRSKQGRVVYRYLDLFVLNTMRVRDHGIPDYNSLRAAFGLKKHEKFEQIFENQKDRLVIEQSYNSIDNIDANVGILGQKKLANSFLGQTGATISGMQFKALRNADRFWFEYAYPQQVISQIKSTTLQDIINRNTDVKDMPKNGFQCNDCTVD